MPVVEETHLLDVVKEIGPQLREAGEEAERERRLPKRAINLLAEAGLQRMFLPQSLDGLEVDPVTCARVVGRLARPYHWAASTCLVQSMSRTTNRTPVRTLTSASGHRDHHAVI